MKSCPTPQQCLPIKTAKIVRIAADYGGHELKQYLVMMLRDASAQVLDFGNLKLVLEDDFPDFVMLLARAVADGRVERGVAICGSGVGACIVANKVPGVRACRIHDPFSARQGVEDDDLNLICLDGHVVIFSHNHFCRVLAARWIGLTVAQAEPFILNTGSVSILLYAHESADQPAIEMWSSVASVTSDAVPRHREGFTQDRAIQRWKNEGGEISPSIQNGRKSS